MPGSGTLVDQRAGLLESAYEIVLADSIRGRGLGVERHKPLSLELDGKLYHNVGVVDLLINEELVVELKSCERLAPVHHKQVLTYLRVLRLPLGLLINFGADQFGGCVKRIVNGHHDPRGSRLRIHSASG